MTQSHCIGREGILPHEQTKPEDAISGAGPGNLPMPASGRSRRARVVPFLIASISLAASRMTGPLRRLWNRTRANRDHRRAVQAIETQKLAAIRDARLEARRTATREFERACQLLEDFECRATLARLRDQMELAVFEIKQRSIARMSAHHHDLPDGATLQPGSGSQTSTTEYK